MNKYGLLLTFLLMISLLWVFSGNVSAKEVKNEAVSPALAVISSRLTMVKSSTGNKISLSSEDFDRAVGAKVHDITVVGLPNEGCGVLSLGGMDVCEGQRIDRDSIDELTFVCGDGADRAEMTFKYDGGEYLFSCVLRRYDGDNYAPSSLGIDESFYEVKTYKNLALCGNMRVNDPEGDGVVFEITDYPDKGLLSVTDRERGDYTYTPVKNYTGNDSFSYVAIDEYGNRSAEITVNVTVSRSKNDTVYGDMIGHPCHYGAVLMTDLGIMKGATDGTGRVFMPELEVSINDFITCSLKAAGIINMAATKSECLEVAVGLGLIDSETEVGAVISRADACIILDKLIDHDADKSKLVFADGEQIPDAAEEAVYTMAELNVLYVEGGFVYPHDPLDRGEMARMLSALVSGT